VKPVREPDAGKPHVRFDEKGRETRDGPLGGWTPTRKGGNSGAPPDLYTTALALHSTEAGSTRIGTVSRGDPRNGLIQSVRLLAVAILTGGLAAAVCLDPASAADADRFPLPTGRWPVSSRQRTRARSSVTATAKPNEY